MFKNKNAEVELYIFRIQQITAPLTLGKVDTNLKQFMVHLRNKKCFERCTISS